MSTTSGDGPIGAPFGIVGDDPDVTPEERRAMPGRHAEPDAPIIRNDQPQTLEGKADQIVKREAGVTNFADADTADGLEEPIEDYPGQGDPETASPIPDGNIITDAADNIFGRRDGRDGESGRGITS